MSFCALINNGITIQPDGEVAICCKGNRDWSLGHISKIDDLEHTWYNHEDMIKLRNEDYELKQLVCGDCLTEKLHQRNRWHQINEGRGYKRVRHDNKIRFLEFTTSNICNQACITCSSYFSSKWRKLEDELDEFGFLENSKQNMGIGFGSYNHKLHRLEGTDIDKIKKLLPNLDRIEVKGGEPFADKNNFIILEELLKVNPNCSITFCTNFYKVPQPFIDLFKKYNNFPMISVSIDGVYGVYEYVRSTPFQQTVNNIKHWYNETGKQVHVAANCSLYTMYNLKDYFEYFENNLLDEVTDITFAKWIGTPDYVSPIKVLHDFEKKDYVNNYLSELKPYTKNERYYTENLFTIEHKRKYFTIEGKLKIRKDFRNYTRFMNSARGIDIYELCPQLKYI